MEDLSDMKNIFPDSFYSHLFIDLPGHGKSSLDHFDSREDIFIALKNLIESFNEKEIVYYGYSMGGRIALELALFYKSPTNLIIESGSFGLSTKEEREKRLNSDLSLFSASYNPHEFFNEWYKNPIFYDYNQSELFKIDLEKKSNHDYKLWQKSLSFFSPGSSPYLLQDIIKKLQSASFKISAIFGEKDFKYKEHFEMVKKEVPHLDLFEIKNAGHNPHKSYPSEVKGLLKKLKL
jgi:2-succinyl-6-hydroxy-2,4-cyclohexadiene-1-carboxylate synthase